ncbi:sensor histidine kinase [Kribbella sp. NPDC050470]|uniref:sensor histidine kinase n=1 Tax=unclassified Kribbella TaxID=2644121 RepID=UPI0037B5A747
MHLRTKLTLGILLATLATFVAVGFVAIPAAKIALRDRIDARLRADLPAIRASVVTPRGELIPGALESVGALGDRAYALVLVGRSGVKVLATSGPPGAPDPPPELAVGDLAAPGGVEYAEAADGSQYRYTTVDIGGDRSLVVAAPVDDLGELVDDLTRTFTLLATGGAGVLALMSWWWIRRSTRPIERLTERAEAIAGGDADRTLSVPAGIAELRRLTRALDAMVASVDASLAIRTQSEARLREFVANASHELRTPLTSISGYLQLDLDGALAGHEQHRRSMGRALAEASRMRRIVADLQLLTELDEDLTPATADVDLVEVLHEAIADANAVDPTRTRTLDVGDAPLIVRVNADQLRQVIANLLDNVRVHTPPGTATVVSAGRQGGGVVIEVADDGPGVPDDELHRVFDRFWRHDVSRSRGSGGSGLGLSIVAAIVATHRGAVHATRSPGGGLAVRITLPSPNGAPPWTTKVVNRQ